MHLKKQINLVLLAFCFFFVCVGGYSIYRISAIQAGYAAARNDYIEIQEEYKTEKPAWDFKVIEEGVSTPGSPVHVNFDALRRSMNGEICAWIRCPETVIDYPVAQHSDNSFYLSHSANMTESSSGAIFIDASNFNDFRDRNTILHGHHMGDGSMFASLKYWYRDENYIAEHPVMYLNTASSGDYRIELFAGFETVESSRAYQFEFSGKDDIDSWISWVLLNNQIPNPPSMAVSCEDRFITLSTCAYSSDDARTVLIGKLVPIG